MEISQLRGEIIDRLGSQGFNVNQDGTICCHDNPEKELIRNLHKHYRCEKLLLARRFINSTIDEISSFFADGSAINIEKFSPRLYAVTSDTIYSTLFRFATLLWSVPVSQGFGRRQRFLVIDEFNNKLVGLFAIGDPVFNLKVRDQRIGWNHKDRIDRLYNVMDIFTVGAVPPYSGLLCGKLMALIATCDEVRDYVWHKYINALTTIMGRFKNPHLVLLTTSSALGRSSLFNRIALNGTPHFIHIGETEGWGHFHLGNSTFQLMREYLEAVQHPIIKANRFGQGPNWKIRTIRTCLELLNLPASMLQHGIKRQVYIAPLAENYKDFLLGITDKPSYYDLSMNKLVEYFKYRWFKPRAERCPDYKKITASNTLADLRQYSQLEER